jgi:hypothetical protein
MTTIQTRKIIFGVMLMIAIASLLIQSRIKSSGQLKTNVVKAFLPEVGHDTSPRLPNMAQVPITRNEVGLGQSIKAQEGITTRGTGSGAILIAGILPETNGEVGATQRVEIVNRGYQIFDNLTGTSVLGPSDISTIWAGFGGPCETGGAGDAVVLYDKIADRWVISQFASATGGKPASEECFAVSTTSDATGSYYRYTFHLGANFIDSPHLSVRPSGYLMGDNVYDESGTERLGNQFFMFDRTAMLTGAAATFTSPGIDTGVGETYSISAHGVRVTSAAQLKSAPIQPAVSTLTINLTYASDATFTAAGLSTADIVNMKSANTFAASQFTNNFMDPINVNILVTAVPGINTLGGSNTSLFSQPFTTGIRDATRADATTPDDATMAGAGGSVPAGLADPIGGTHNWWVTKAQRKALGITADDFTSDGTYTFGGGWNYTYDPNNRAVAGKTDYIGVSMHEFSEIMGRIPGLGTTSIDGTPAYLQMDLFHYAAANTRGLTNGPGRSFSIDNGTTLLKAFNDASVCTKPCDPQDWASGTSDSFNAFSSSGVKNDLTAVDLRVMDVIGYDLQSAANSCTSAQMTSPANGSTIGTTTTLTWNKPDGNDQYYLVIGTTGAGSSNVLSESQGTNASKTLSNLPQGSLYVRLWSHCASTNVWSNNDYSYVVSGSCTTAQMTSPANGANIPSSQTFTWNTGSGNGQYYLHVGTTGVGSSNLLAESEGANTSRTLSNLPGPTIYVRLWSYCTSTSTWAFNDYVYHPPVGCATAQMTSPANGANIPSSQTFTWNTGSGNGQYYLHVGTTGVGSFNLLAESEGANTSRTLSNLPGTTIYVRLWSYCTSTSTWAFNDYSYRVSSAIAQMTSPANGSTFGSTNVTFTWSLGIGNSQYFLYVGNSPGTSEYFYSSVSGGSTAVSGLPTNGRNVYVRLWSLNNGQWFFTDYNYQGCACGGNLLARIVSPANTSKFGSSSVTFSWTAASGGSQYFLYVGNSVGSSEYFYNYISGGSTSVGGLPSDGRSIYVRIWSWINGQWFYNDYIYRASGGSSGNQFDEIAPPISPGPSIESLLIPSESWRNGLSPISFTLK